VRKKKVGGVGREVVMGVGERESGKGVGGGETRWWGEGERRGGVKTYWSEDPGRKQLEEKTKGRGMSAVENLPLR